jgi:MinD-like ATPase involved in chromosome partitioning or flagellar assembly
VDALGQLDPAFASAVRRQLAGFGARLVGNQIVNARDRKTVEALTRMFRDFLGLEVPVVGWLRFNRKVFDSVNERVPLLAADPDDDVARAVVRVAEQLLAEDVTALRLSRRELAGRPGALDPLAEAALVEDIEALLRGPG